MADSQPADELEEPLEVGDDMAIDQGRAGKRRRAGKEEAAAKAEIAAKTAMDKTQQEIKKLDEKPRGVLAVAVSGGRCSTHRRQACRLAILYVQPHDVPCSRVSRRLAFAGR